MASTDRVARVIGVRALPGWARWVAVGVAVAAALAIGYRVLAPSEVSTSAKGAPPAPLGSRAGVIGALSSAPLIVDGRVRVYAGQRLIRADGPVDQKTQWSPFWSYRRWPAQLVGLAAVGGTVVSQWSDGEVVGLAADRGVVRWRMSGPALPDASYQGRRTGASTVYAPPHLYAAGGVAVAAGSGEARGYDGETGRELWRSALPSCGERVDFTVGARFAWACGATLAALDAGTGQRLRDWTAPGPVTPLGCGPGSGSRSDCHGLRAGGKGFVWGPVEPAAAPALDAAGSWLVTGANGEQIAVDQSNTGRDATTGRRLWHWNGPARVIAVERGLVHLLTGSHRLVTLDAATGDKKSTMRATAYGQATTWAPGAAAAMDGYVAVERLRAGARPDDPNGAYYFEARPVLLARTTNAPT